MKRSLLLLALLLALLPIVAIADNGLDTQCRAMYQSAQVSHNNDIWYGNIVWCQQYVIHPLVGHTTLKQVDASFNMGTPEHKSVNGDLVVYFYTKNNTKLYFQDGLLRTISSSM